MRFILLVLATLGHLAAAVPNSVADARFGQLVGTEVSASAYDAASGTLYVGGLFTGWQQPDGFGGTLAVTRGNLCAFAADGSIRSWAPTTDGQVLGMYLSGTTLYVFGYFSQVNGVPRSRLAAISTVDGTLLSFNANITGSVINDVCVIGGTLYIGGGFTQVGGQPRAQLAAVDATTGSLAAWNPGCTGGGGGGVYALAASGSVIYIGGWFDSVGGQPRTNAAAVNTAGTVLAWNPNATGSENGGHIIDLQVGFGAVFAGGFFDNIGGVARPYFAALDPTSGSDVGWNLPCNQFVDAIALTASDVIIGGGFTTVGGQPREKWAIISSAGALNSWQPTPAETVYTIAAGNGGIFGGSSNFCAFLPVGSAVPLPAAPSTTPDPRFGHLIGTEISASAYDEESGTLYVGGVFNGWQQPDGFGGTLTVTRGNLCAFAADGSLRSWAPTTNGQIYGMCLSGTTLYIAGYFSQVNGVPRPLVAAISTVDGSLLPFDADIAGSFVDDIAISGGLLYVGGNFTQVHGQPRAWLAAVDAISGAVAPWNPGCTGGLGVTAMEASGGVIYIGGSFDHVGGQPRLNAAAVDTSGNLLAWNPNASGSENGGLLKEVKVAFGMVFVGGYFQNIGGVARTGFAALDPVTGNDLGWSLTSNRAVFSISPTGSGLVIGGIFDTVGGQSRVGRAIVSRNGILTSWQPTPGDGFYTIVAGNGGVYGGAAFYAHSPIDSTPAETIDVNKPDSMAVIGGLTYFGGSTARYGRELWVTDGTPAGTSLVKDIIVGNSGSGARHVTAMGGKVYFSANDGAHGRELWVSDGTDAGTHIVKDIAPGGNSSNPQHLFSLGSKLVFTAFSPGIGWGMWATDGTDVGTVLINDVEPANTADEYSYNWGATYCVVGSTLYFNATNAAHGSALWKTDGTAGGSQVVKNIAPGGAGGTPIAMTTMGGKLYYTSRDDNSQLWVSDGTDAGTVQYTNAFWYCDFTTAINGLIYTRATTGSMTNGMWVTDGNPSNLTLLSPTLNAAGFYVERGGKAYMNPDAPSPYTYRPLVGSDGTPGGTGVIADVSCHIPYTVGNTLYFSSATDVSARLWKSDGTDLGTVKVTDRITNAATVGQVAGKALVSRLPDWNDYSAVWASDGTDGGTVRLLPRTVVAFTAPTAGSSWSTTLTSLPVAGTADDPQGVLAVTWQLSGATSGSGTATGTTSWNFTPTLNPGTTTITVSAQSTDGNTDSAALTVTVTAPPVGSPTIAISLPTTGDSWLSTGGGVTIAGTTSGTTAVTGVTYALSGATSISGTATGTTSWTFSPTLNPGITIVTMTAVDSNNQTGQDAITITRDLSDPVVAISSPTNSGSYVTGAAPITIVGSATDDGGIVTVSYQLSGATTAAGTATGTTTWSLSTPALNHGTTTVTITARDVANRTSVATLDLVYPITGEMGPGGAASSSCGLGSGLAAMLSFTFLALMRFRRRSPAERRVAG